MSLQLHPAVSTKESPVDFSLWPHNFEIKRRRVWHQPLPSVPACKLPRSQLLIVRMLLAKSTQSLHHKSAPRPESTVPDMTLVLDPQITHSARNLNLLGIKEGVGKLLALSQRKPKTKKRKKLVLKVEEEGGSGLSYMEIWR